MFQKLDPKTKVPVIGAWICCFFECLISFFLDLETLVKIVSLGNLLTYAFVTAGALSLRYRKENH